MSRSAALSSPRALITSISQDAVPVFWIAMRSRSAASALGVRQTGARSDSEGDDEHAFNHRHSLVSAHHPPRRIRCRAPDRRRSPLRRETPPCNRHDLERQPIDLLVEGEADQFD